MHRLNGVSMGFEQAVSNWLHATYTDADHLYQAASSVITDPLNIAHTAYSVRQVVDGVWNVAYDLTPFGFLASLWHGLAVNSAPAFASSWPLGNLYLSTGEQMTNPPLVIANAYRCAIQMTFGGRPVVNVIGLLGSSAGQAGAAAAALKAAWEAAGGPLKLLPTTLTMTGYTVTDLSSPTGSVALLSSSTAGGRSLSVSDRGMCCLIKFSGGTRSRSSNGRVYLGPLTSADTGADGATIVGATVTLFSNAWTQFENAMGTAGFPVAVLSRKTDTAHVVSSFAVQTTIATQRRRIRGG
jgi:hypothetical protein